MRFHRLFKIVFYQMVLAGYAALLYSGRLDLLSAIAYPACLPWLYFRKPAPPERTGTGRTLLLSLLLTLLFLADLTLISADFTLAVVHLALILSLIRLHAATTPRDHLHVFLFSFGFLMLSTLYVVDPWFLFFASWFLVSGLLSLMMMEIRTSADRFAPSAGTLALEADAPAASFMELPPHAGDPRLPVRSVTALGLFAYGGIIMLTIPIFLILPRLSVGLWGRSSDRGVQMSGFSETTRLGDITSIARNEMVVMRIRTSIPPEQLPVDLKWKGLALETYDGRGWSHLSDEGFRTAIPVVDNGFYHIQREPETPRILRQDIYLEPLGTPILFMAETRLAVAGRLGEYLIRNGEAIQLPVAGDFKLRYTAFSDLKRPDRRQLALAPPLARPGEFRNCLELPGRSPVLAGLVEQLTRGIWSPYARAEAIQAHLQRTCRYSLDMPACPEGVDPVEFFLLQSRVGHCEYFATSFAILLRYAGIPSRIVNGFQRGEVNPFNQMLVVRQSDAHSWVEAWFEGAGWVEMDPTPAGDDGPARGFGAWLGAFVEYLQFFWYGNVVNYDTLDQMRLFQQTRSQMRELRSGLSAWFAGWRKWAMSVGSAEWGSVPGGVWGVAALALVVVGLLAWPAWRRRRRRIGRTGAAAARAQRPPRVIPLFERLQKLAADAGAPRDPAETPRAFAGRLDEFCPSDAVAEFFEAYHHLRYDPGIGEQEHQPRLESGFRRLEPPLTARAEERRRRKS